MAHFSSLGLQYAAWTTAVAPTPIISFISYSSAELGHDTLDPKITRNLYSLFYGCKNDLIWWVWKLFNLNGTGQNLPCADMFTDAIFSVALATAGAVASETPGESYE